MTKHTNPDHKALADACTRKNGKRLLTDQNISDALGGGWVSRETKNRLWTYEELTAHTEKAIQEQMECVQRNKHRSTAADAYRAFAFGMYINWYDLTCGYSQDADNQRLKALIEATV